MRKKKLSDTDEASGEEGFVKLAHGTRPTYPSHHPTPPPLPHPAPRPRSEGAKIPVRHQRREGVR